MAHFLVTGGAGFVGSHIVRALLARGDRVRVLDDLSTGRLENLAGLELDLRRGSIVDPAACAAACTGVDGVFHEAAQVSVPRSVEDPRASYAVNVTGTLNVLEACRAARVPRLVFASSSAAYGDAPELPKSESMTPRPLSPYASGKLAGEDLLRVYGALHGLRGVSLRYFNVFGPRQVDDSPYTGVIAIFARALLEGRRATIFGDGAQTRDLTYVDNVVAANLAAMQRDLEPGVVINVGGGERVSILELYRTLAELAGSRLEPQFAPARAGDVRDSLASIEQARALLGYVPRVGWREGLARTLAWYRERLGAARVV
ncbi:MAG: SDR family oxidoreductase [Planctomycetes bacterium]|nr:SDR family oxidoreductase [Planctomycetota bacterium]